MDPFAEFLSRLLHQGRVVFRGRPEPAPAPSSEAVGVLAAAYDGFALDVAGPPVAFDAAVAAEAGELVRQACWALVCREERVESLARRLTMRRSPPRPSDHLSADLLLRYLPQVHRRARAVDPSDPLASRLADVLRRWPLSGVLSDLDDGPEPPPDFGGHPGLALLYAERLARRDRPSWRPGGTARAYYDLVLQGQGRGGDGSG